MGLLLVYLCLVDNYVFEGFYLFFFFFKKVFIVWYIRSSIVLRKEIFKNKFEWEIREVLSMFIFEIVKMIRKLVFLVGNLF